MAADGLLHDPASAGVLSAAATAALAWLGNRLVGKAAIQTAINASFKDLMDQLRQELRVALRERDTARDEVEALKKVIDALEARLTAANQPRWVDPTA
jgi:BMFP domain-containing protein YqiC